MCSCSTLPCPRTIAYTLSSHPQFLVRYLLPSCFCNISCHSGSTLAPRTCLHSVSPRTRPRSCPKQYLALNRFTTLPSQSPIQCVIFTRVFYTASQLLYTVWHVGSAVLYSLAITLYSISLHLFCTHPLLSPSYAISRMFSTHPSKLPYRVCLVLCSILPCLIQYLTSSSYPIQHVGTGVPSPYPIQCTYYVV